MIQHHDQYRGGSPAQSATNVVGQMNQANNLHISLYQSMQKVPTRGQPEETEKEKESFICKTYAGNKKSLRPSKLVPILGKQ